MAAAYGVRADGGKGVGVRGSCLWAAMVDGRRGCWLRAALRCEERSRRTLGAALLAVVLALSVVSPPAKAAPIRLLILGDSLTAGYGLPHADGFEVQLQQALHAHGYDVSIIDGAVSGDTSAGGRARLDWVLADGADAAIVELGANDGLRGLDPSAMEANLRAILDTLAAKHIPTLFTGMYAPPNLGPDYERAYRAVFDRLGQRPGLLYDPFFLQGVAEVPGLIQPDGLHPNAEGVRREVARLLPLVEKLLQEARPA
ncbi:MAG TPA: arylesterase [Acetobacteraceae bacterium]|nr:arylesterase [Acetobacteraceae bacterium]